MWIVHLTIFQTHAVKEDPKNVEEKDSERRSIVVILMDVAMWSSQAPDVKTFLLEMDEGLASDVCLSHFGRTCGPRKDVRESRLY